MPAKSAKQKRFMQAVANNPKFAKKVNIPQSVGEEYSKESKMYNKKMMNGGKVKKMMDGGKVKKMMGGGMAMAAPELALWTQEWLWLWKHSVDKLLWVA
jgi:translation elongation factor EF-Ts